MKYWRDSNSKHEVKPGLFLSALSMEFMWPLKPMWEICGLFLVCMRTFIVRTKMFFNSYSVAQLNIWPLRWWRPLMRKLASTTSAVTCGALASSYTSCWVDTRPLWVAVGQTVVGTGESPAKPARYYTSYLGKMHGFLGSVSKAVKVQNFPWNRSRASHLVS